MFDCLKIASYIDRKPKRNGMHDSVIESSDTSTIHNPPSLTSPNLRPHSLETPEKSVGTSHSCYRSPTNPFPPLPKATTPQEKEEEKYRIQFYQNRRNNMFNCPDVAEIMKGYT